MGIKKINYAAFSYCSNLQNVKLPLSLTSIKSGAFSNCTSLASIEIPQGVTRIEGETFLTCENLASITIPISVTEIELDIFSYYNRSIKHIYYAGSKEQWEKVRKGADLSWPVNYKKVTIHYNDSSSDVGSTDPPAPDQPTNPDKPTTPGKPTDQNKPTTPDSPTTPDTPSASVTITFDAQGGDAVSSINAVKNGRLSYIPLTHKFGYIFQGWFTGTNGTGSMLMLGTEFSQDAVYYAYWTPANRIAIGIGATANGTAFAGDSVYNVLAVRAIYSDGTSEPVYNYTVSQAILQTGSNLITVNWNGFFQSIQIQAGTGVTNTNIKGITVFYNGSEVPVGTYTRFDGLTVKAVYMDGTEREIYSYALSGNTIGQGKNIVTVHYEGKTADFVVTGYQLLAVKMHAHGVSDIWVSKTADLSTVLRESYPVRNGYQFSGWYLDAACTQQVRSGMSATDGMHVYAKWQQLYNWKLNKSKASVKQGKSVRLSVSGLKNTQITWKTSNKKIASVSKEGVIKAKRAGTVIITAVTPDGSVMSCNVTVRKKAKK